MASDAEGHFPEPRVVWSTQGHGVRSKAFSLLLKAARGRAETEHWAGEVWASQGGIHIYSNLGLLGQALPQGASPPLSVLI